MEDPSPQGPRGLARAGLPLVVTAAVLLFHWRAVRPGMAFAGDDIVFFFVAIRDAVASSWRTLSLASWERGLFMGFPLLGDPQGAIFDPATLLTLPLDSARALTVATLMHLIVMGCGMAFWMRVRGLGALEALLAAVLFALGAKQTVHLLHWNFAATTAWWPWMLCGVEGFATDGRRRWLWLLAAASAFSWFGGSPQMAYFGTLVAGAYALATLPPVWRRGRFDVLRLAVAFAAGMLIASPVLLPVAELAAHGSRAGTGQGYGFATSFAWPDRWALALLILPRMFTQDAWPRIAMNLWEATGYLAILPLGLVVAVRVNRRGVPFFGALLVIGIWLSFGEHAWLGLHRALFDHLPGFGKFRVPTRALMPCSFAASVLAAEGLHALRTDPRWLRLVRPCLVFLGVAIAALLLPDARSLPFHRDLARQGAVAAAALAGIGVAWLAIGVRYRQRPAWAWLAIVLVVGDLYLAFGEMNPVVATSRMGPALAPFVGLVPESPSPRRIAAFPEGATNDPQRLGWEGTLGYGPTIIDRARRLIEATRHGTLADRPDTNLLAPSGDPRSSLWPLLATPLVASTGIPGVPVEASAPNPRGGPPIVLQRAAALPRVYWTGAFVVAPDHDVVPLLGAAARGDHVILASPPPVASGERAGPVASPSVRVERSRLEATVVAPRDGWVVIVDPWFPGWSAAMDGKPTTLLRANYAFQAVPVSAGVHQLVLSYENRAFWLGLGLAVVGLAALAAVSYRTRRDTSHPEG